MGTFLHVRLDNLAYLRRVVATWHTRQGLARLSDYTFNLVYHKSVCKLICVIDAAEFRELTKQMGEEAAGGRTQSA